MTNPIQSTDYIVNAQLIAAIEAVYEHTIGNLKYYVGTQSSGYKFTDEFETPPQDLKQNYLGKFMGMDLPMIIAGKVSKGGDTRRLIMKPST